MTPREEFNRTKRWAGLSAAFLIAHLFAGVQQSANGGLFGITLENPNALDEVFLLFMLIFTLKSINIWSMLDDHYRRTIQYIADDLFSLILSITATALYIFNQDYNIPRIGFDVPAYFDVILSILSTTFVFSVALASLFAVRSIRKNRLLLNDISIIRKLTSGDWYLIFANARARASKGEVGWKKISFEESGEIGEGKNHNECTWAVSNGYLEIYNVDGEIFSRFVLAGEGFKATDDSDVKALPGQEIIRDIDLWKQKEV
ncbi:hypothetical protein [Oceanicaulis sp.]|uniref:hypothetical protein n=1 Tax=Oceanicaulis sp. TaxID=1924941 RepID=UPI003F6F8EE6